MYLGNKLGDGLVRELKRLGILFCSRMPLASSMAKTDLSEEYLVVVC